ncbi:MAG: DUF5123 domain-containing protein, partial [Roseimicrobium sp.]
MPFYPKFTTLVAWLVACSAGSATDRYVSTTGTNSNPGTFELPWRTIQKAADSVVAGDVVHIRAGVYTERVTITNKDGTAQSPIIFQKYAADNGSVVIDQTGVTPPFDTVPPIDIIVSALLWIENSDYIRFQNLEFANYKTAGTNNQQKSQLPVGIYITGDGNGLSLSGCRVHDIWQSCTVNNDQTANAFGIAVYGTAATAIHNLTIDGCEIYNLRTGASESVALNGNVTNFSVVNNQVHDCNNIGIDFIGFEGTNATQALDQARNGVCRGNTVYRIDSKFNPAYGGNFTTGGGNGTRSAPGLYVDGGRDIVLERNHIYDCNFAVSVGSEHFGKLSSNVAVRNNILHHCHVGGVVLGGADDQTNGGADNCSITNNTLYDNDTTGYGGGQVMIQNYVTNTTIKRNLIAATTSFVQFILKETTTGGFATDAIDWNRYRHNSGSSYEFIWNGTPYDS